MSTQSYEQLVAGANLIRTNELPESNTHTLVGEQLLQMVNKQQEADDSSRSEIYNVSRYHVNTDGTSIFTLAQAIAMVPARLRVGGTMIKYQSSTGELIAYFNGSAISSWSNVAEWRVFVSDKDFQLAEKTDNKNQPNGYPGLNSTGKLLASQLPDNFQPTSEKGRANGYPALDNSGTIPDAQIPNTVERTSKKNQPNGYPGLNSTGKLLASQLPDNFQPTSEKGRANGYPALDNSGTIPDAQIPNTVERTSKKNQPNGYPGLNSTGKLLASQLPDNFQPTSEKGRANGYAALDNSGTIPDAQIPSTVERVENKNKANGYPGLDADGLLDNRQVRKAFGYKFDGVDDRIVINHNNLLNFGSNDFTIEAVVKPTNKATSTIASKTGNSDLPRWYFRLLNSSKNIEFAGNSVPNTYAITAYNAVVFGKNNHIIVTRSGDVMRIYNNGELLVERDGFSNLSFDNNFSLSVGGSVLLELANGDISLFRIYKRGFAQSDVDYYYNLGRPDLTRLTYDDKVNKTTTGCALELLPENATLGKWMDTQNSLDGGANGNPAINYGNVIPEPYVYPFKRYIRFEKHGDGTGLSYIDTRVNKSGKAKIIGGEFFSKDNTGISLGTEINTYKDTNIMFYVKLNANSGILEIDNPISIVQGSTNYNNNSPVIVTNASELIDYTYVTASTENILFGFVSDIPRTVTTLGLPYAYNEKNSIVGEYRDLPMSMNGTLHVNTSFINGDIKYIPNVKVLRLYNTTNKTIGDISNLPETLSDFEINGAAIISGDLGLMRGTFKNLVIVTLGTFTYSSGLKVNSIFNRIQLRPAVGSFTSAMTDQLLIDLAEHITSFTGLKTIDLTGNCGAPTAASSTARATLSGLGATVLTN